MHLIPIGYEVHLVCPLEDPFGEDEWTDLTYLLADIAEDDEQYLHMVQFWDDHGDPPNGNGPWSIAVNRLSEEQAQRLHQEGWHEARVAVFQVQGEGASVDEITRSLVDEEATFNYLTHQAVIYLYPAPGEVDCSCGHKH